MGCASGAEDGETQAEETQTAETEETVAAAGTDAPPPAQKESRPLMNPSSPEMNATAPGSFTVRFETSAGEFDVAIHRDWSPHGADRFYNLIRNGYYDDVRFFRVLEGFMAQFGISGDPALNRAWRTAQIPDDPVLQSNTRGRITYAKSNAPNSRTTQLFINFGDNSQLDDMGFAPFGEVVAGMEAVDALYSQYGEGAPQGRGPNQGKVQSEGNAYLEVEFPELDYIVKATILDEG
jgi:peptidyl-prolyl cis-trans isomerase A (cyclophilin A)